MLLNCGVGEDSWESLGLQGNTTSPSSRKSFLNIHWKDWCWSWNSSTLATSCEGLTHWKRLWCREGLGAGGEGDIRGWDGWMASLTMDMSLSELWELVMDREAWRAVIHGVAKSRHDWTTELNWWQPCPTNLVFYILWCNMHACVLSHLSYLSCFVILWTVPYQAPLSMEFSR